KDAGPCDREAISIDTHFLHQLYVILVAVIVVDRHVACIAVLHLAGRVRVRVPDRWSLAILVPGSFDLIRRGSHAPIEALRKLEGTGTQAGSADLCRRLSAARCRRCDSADGAATGGLEERSTLRIGGHGQPPCMRYRLRRLPKDRLLQKRGPACTP